MNGHKIVEIVKNSIAEEVGIEPNDTLISINGEIITDALDYHFLAEDEELTLLIYKSNLNEEWSIEIEKEYNEDLGIVFESNLMDEYKSCCNKCVFCFIDQLPPGMRETLYFKDDDARLSFLQGNYVTLTNMKDHDIDRIIKYHLSPINISVHTMNLELRKKMLNNRFADKIKGYMDRLFEANILMNGQIVLCKGLNDGEELEASIEALSAYLPYLQSVSIVPVGLSKYRHGLATLEPFDKEDALAVIKTVEKWQKRIYDSHETHFIHAGDEFYFLAEVQCPREQTYDGYLQLENGVGMTRLLIDEFNECYNEIKPSPKRRTISIATGQLIAPVIQDLVLRLTEKHTNLQVYIYPIVNRFFGERITVSGLLTGTDIIEQLKDKNLGDELLLPSNLLRSGEDVLLDNMTLSDIEKSLNTKVVTINPSGEDFIQGILG
ncbi:MAG: radical SAM protein [Firmicutes bacterium HGW-Firmicutes-1]|jgi:putative radical SAM enzyme (TIGR03279 family)|nr:MAG: radical SAM protein [Firmicutes bacterium HGW-Firmicutes-1]